MPIGLGIGMSHPSTIRATNPADWVTSYKRLIRVTPQPAAAAAESEEVIQGYIDRVQASLGVLRKKLHDYAPDLLIVIGGDQSEVFDRSNVANLMIYLDAEVAGYEVQRVLGGEALETRTDVPIKVDVETSRWLLRKLVKEEGFDVAFSTEQRSLGGRGEGVSHAFWRPALTVFGSTLPTVLIWENTYDPPSLSAARCYALGQTLARIFRDDPRRIAILGSGGLSHDPGGPRSGWIDTPLDRWFLDQLSEGNAAATVSMYTFDSFTMASGTGEMRAWITAAGAMEAMGSRFELADYVPAHHAVTGLAFATWTAPEAAQRTAAEAAVAIPI